VPAFYTVILPIFFIGCLAYQQSNLQIFFAQTTVTQIAYVLAGLLVVSEEGRLAALLYLFIYSLTLLAFFAVLALLKQNGAKIFSLDDLISVAKKNNLLRVILVVLIASLAGLPPLGGFVIKYLVLVEVYNAGYFIVF
jgi:NADH-quinone oxidoreductase subunit N